MGNLVTMSGEVLIEPFEITKAMLDPFFASLNGNIATMVPYGMTIMATMIGISLIKRIVYTFL